MKLAIFWIVLLAIEAVTVVWWYTTGMEWRWKTDGGMGDFMLFGLTCLAFGTIDVVGLIITIIYKSLR